MTKAEALERLRKRSRAFGTHRETAELLRIPLNTFASMITGRRPLNDAVMGWLGIERNEETYRIVRKAK